jgi:hypothetical protein
MNAKLTWSEVEVLVRAADKRSELLWQESTTLALVFLIK